MNGILHDALSTGWMTKWTLKMTTRAFKLRHQQTRQSASQSNQQKETVKKYYDKCFRVGLLSKTLYIQFTKLYKYG